MPERAPQPRRSETIRGFGTPARCRLFGHNWDIPGRPKNFGRKPNYCQPKSTRLVCKRCGAVKR